MEEEYQQASLILERMRCELRAFGRRSVFIDAQALCDHLDSLLGPQISEVIMNNHRVRMGKEDAARIREQRPKATVQEIIDLLIKAHCITGVGITRVTMPKKPEDPIDLEVSNPAVGRNLGAAKAFVFSYWSGILSNLLGTEFEAKNVAHDEGRDLLRGQLVVRQTAER